MIHTELWEESKTPVCLWGQIERVGSYKPLIEMGLPHIQGSQMGVRKICILPSILPSFLPPSLPPSPYLFRTAPVAYGSSQARGRIRVTATATCDLSHFCELHWAGTGMEPTSSWMLVRLLPLSHNRNSLISFFLDDLVILYFVHSIPFKPREAKITTS